MLYIPSESRFKYPSVILCSYPKMNFGKSELMDLIYLKVKFILFLLKNLKIKVDKVKLMKDFERCDRCDRIKMFK